MVGILLIERQLPSHERFRERPSGQVRILCVLCQLIRYSSELAAAMLEEWKVIQTKIDKIGEFRFHIKNWAVTVAVAFIVGAYVTNSPPSLIMAVLLPTWAFFLVEKRQEKILSVLVTRAERLERAMQRLAASLRTEAESAPLVKLMGAAGSVPGLAGALRKFARSRRFDRLIFNEIIFYIVLSLFIGLLAAGDSWRIRTNAQKDAQKENQLHRLDTKVVLPDTIGQYLERLSSDSERSRQELTCLRVLLSHSEMSLFGAAPNSAAKSHRANGYVPKDESIDIVSEDHFHLYLGGTGPGTVYSKDPSQ